MQIFHQILFVFGLLLVFGFFPSLRELIEWKTNEVLHFLLGVRYVFLLVPLTFIAIAFWAAFLVGRGVFFGSELAADLFQANIFAEGRLYAPAPAPIPFFFASGDYLAIHHNRWFSIQPPGFALALAPFVSLGLEKLIPLILLSLTVALWMLYVRKWYSPLSALLYGCFALFSPMFLMLSWDASLDLFLIASSVYLCRSDEEQPAAWKSAGLFFLTVWMILTRYFWLFFVLSPIFIHTFYIRFRARRYSSVIALSAGFLSGTALLLNLSSQTTGGSEFSCAWINSDLRIAALPALLLGSVSHAMLTVNEYLGGWYSGSLFFILIFLLWNPGFDKWDYLLLISCLFAGFSRTMNPGATLLLFPYLMVLAARTVEIKDIFIRKLVFPLLIVSFLSCLPDRLPALIQRFRPSKAAEQLHHEVRKLKQTPTVIFLEDSVVTKFVPWNDPFLRNSVILAHDLRSQNTELGKSFPNYRWLQARILRSYEEFALKLNLVSGDQFQYEPEGYSSMFQLASAVIETSKHPQRDIFDWNPEGILSSGENNLSYLENSAREAMRKGGYRKDIHLGLIHLARLLLLPQSSRQNPGEFPIAEFRKQFEAAEALFRSAGETGKVLAAELLKVQRRIDQDSDDHLSDEEIRNYFLRKSLYWKIQKRGVPREELCYE